MRNIDAAISALDLMPQVFTSGQLFEMAEIVGGCAMSEPSRLKVKRTLDICGYMRTVSKGSAGKPALWTCTVEDASPKIPARSRRNGHPLPRGGHRRGVIG